MLLQCRDTRKKVVSIIHIFSSSWRLGELQILCTLYVYLYLLGRQYNEQATKEYNFLRMFTVYLKKMEKYVLFSISARGVRVLL